MTKDKLEKEAGESWWNDNNCSGALSTKKIYICGYLASAEPREKRIAELEAQIEKMKCCHNYGYRIGVKENCPFLIEHSSDKRLEPILQKLKDLGVIKSWYYNGTYHAQ